MDDQVVLDGAEHSAHHQRNASNPFYSGSATPEIDVALGIQSLGDPQAVVKRDSMGRPVRKSEAVAPLGFKI